MTAAALEAAPYRIRDRATRNRALVRGWLYAVLLVLFALFLVGGATRLTHSGLSITEWQPIHGVIPPLDDAEWQRLLLATGGELDDLSRIADDVRRYTVGEAITIAVNRNLTSTGFRAAGAQTPDQFDLADAAAIAADAWDLGATELCIQGLVPADEAPTAYLDIVRAARAAAPDIHLHA